MISGLSVVVPVYNSEQTLEMLVERLEAVLRQEAEAYELLLVDDGSRDGSWAKIQRLSERYAWVRGMQMMRNYGQHNALLCGLRAARYEVTVTMDDDLQNPPEEMPRLLQKLGEGYDVVYGTPRAQRQSWWRNQGSLIIRLSLQAAMGVQAARYVSPYRAINTQVRRAFAAYQSPYVMLDVLLAWGTTRFAQVEVRHDPRKIGTSNYSLRKLISLGITMTTGFSVLPLKLASLAGFAFALFGVLVLLYVLVRYVINGGSVPGFPFLASIIAIFSGVQLFALGIIGEYLARMHFRMLEKPPYVVRQQTYPPGGEKQATTRVAPTGNGVVEEIAYPPAPLPKGEGGAWEGERGTDHVPDTV
jgi:glycosyltransferase involved in cell wall biosynthesis